MSGRILPFRRPPRIANCASCGAHFRPKAQHHTRCAPCYWWARAIAGLAAAQRAAEALRSEGYR
jgi:hypothetical protein